MNQTGSLPQTPSYFQRSKKKVSAADYLLELSTEIHESVQRRIYTSHREASRIRRYLSNDCKSYHLFYSTVVACDI